MHLNTVCLSLNVSFQQHSTRTATREDVAADEDELDDRPQIEDSDPRSPSKKNKKGTDVVPTASGMDADAAPVPYGETPDGKVLARACEELGLALEGAEDPRFPLLLFITATGSGLMPNMTEAGKRRYVASTRQSGYSKITSVNPLMNQISTDMSARAARSPRSAKKAGKNDDGGSQRGVLGVGAARAAEQKEAAAVAVFGAGTEESTF